MHIYIYIYIQKKIQNMGYKPKNIWKQYGCYYEECKKLCLILTMKGE